MFAFGSALGSSRRDAWDRLWTLAAPDPHRSSGHTEVATSLVNQSQVLLRRAAFLDNNRDEREKLVDAAIKGYDLARKYEPTKNRVVLNINITRSGQASATVIEVR